MIGKQKRAKKQKTKKILIKKASNNDNVFLANTIGQTLKEHSIAVALYGHSLLKSFKFNSNMEKKINTYLIYSALLHDIGKVSASFQNYIKSKKANNNNLEDMPMDTEASRPKTFKGPFHNEISWAYITNFVDFDNEETKKIICHSVYWHHPANCSDNEDKLRFENSEVLFKNVEDNLKEEVSNLLNDVYVFVDDLFNSFSSYYENDYCQHNLKKPQARNIKEIQCPKFFLHKDEVSCNAQKQLCLNLLLESDRIVSSWKTEKLIEFLEKWKTWKTPSCKTEKISILEELDSNQKSKEQHILAQKMANKKLSVCGVDPAGGKTSISLYWWHECNTEHSLMIALPRQNQVTGLFESLKVDCKRVYGNKKIKMEAVFNGKRQHDNWNLKDTDDFLISDINILVFDRFLSPYYKRIQSSEFLKMLQSHLILDEFHEFKDIPKMIPSLKEILTIRSWINSGIKTLMLSGTPEPSLLKLLCVEGNSIFQRTELPPRNNHQFKIFEEKKDVKEVQFFSDCLYSFLRVESCQDVFSQFFKVTRDKIKMIHSYFIVSDKKELLEKILKEHGKEQNTAINDKSVITSKMLQSSYNLSFDKAILELSQPYMDCQTAGRINRFENKPNAEIHFIHNEESETFFDSRRAGFKEIHKNWKKHILLFIKDHKGQAVSIRKLMESYDSFWDEDNINESLNILRKDQKKAMEELNKYIPKRFLASKKTKTSSALNSLFRGESRFLSACKVDDNGKPIGQLYGENLLSEGRNWFINKTKESMEVCLKSKVKCEKANKINSQDGFEYKKYIKIFGFKIERPLLCSHINEEIDQCLSDNLFDEDSNITYHRVYHKRFGLVKKCLLGNE